MVAGVAAAQQMIPIVNPGFEEVSRPLAENEVTNGSGGADVPVGTRQSLYGLAEYDNLVSVPGWRTFEADPNDPGSIVYAGVMNPPEAGEGSIEGLGGTNVAALMVSPMQQTLPVLVQPSTTYRLTFRAGFANGFTTNGVYVALIGAPDLETPVYFAGADSAVIAVGSGLNAPQST
ncbi:MAG: hypothetical protein AAFY46_11525, partial [Planctomycetota bacterium]